MPTTSADLAVCGKAIVRTEVAAAGQQAAELQAAELRAAGQQAVELQAVA
ncbi:MAG: hypothetical protein ACYC4N_24000 [Pirellulaceae bacterium]